MNPSPASQPGRHRELILLGVFAFAVTLVFGGAIYADFVPWDDDINIYDNPGIRGLGLENLWWMFTDTEYVRRYMPLGWLSLAIDYQWQGLNPGGYHLGNVVLHYLNAVFVFFVIRKLLQLAPNRGDAGWGEKRRFFVAAVAALFWALHPLRVEAVVWASGRLYCQAGLFLLVALWAYLKFVTGEETRRRRSWYVVACVAFLCSLLTYPIGLGWLLVFVVVDRFPLGRFNPGLRGWLDRQARAIWLEKVPFVLIACGVLGVTVWSRVNSTGLWKQPVSLEEFGLLSRIMQGFYVWACYLWKTCWPTDLAPLYVRLMSFDPWEFVFCASALLVMGISVLVVLKRVRWPVALPVWICYLGLLFPVLGLTEHPHFAADRYSYLAGIGYAVLLAAGLDRLCRDPRRAALTLRLATLLVVILAIMSARQTKVWQNGDTLFTHVIKTLGDHPYRYDSYHRLGLYRMSVGQYAKAEQAFREVLKLKPGALKVEAALGDSLALQSRFDEAVEIYTRVVAKAPGHRATRFNLARALTELGRRVEAMDHYSVLLQRHPGDAQLRLAVGRFHVRGGEWRQARQQFLIAAELDPKLDAVCSLLGKCHLKLGQAEEALKYYREAVRREPNSPNALMDLAWVLATVEGLKLGSSEEAIALATRANRLTGDQHPEVLDTLAAAYAAGEQFEAALATAGRALEAAVEADLKKAIRDRLRRYGLGRPYREKRDGTSEELDL